MSQSYYKTPIMLITKTRDGVTYNEIVTIMPHKITGKFFICESIKMSYMPL